MPTVYDDLMTSLGVLSRSPVNPELVKLLEEWRAFFGAAATAADPIADFAVFTAKLTGLMGAPDPQVELELVKEASRNPVLGPAIVLASLPVTTARWAAGFWQSLYTEEQARPAGTTGTDVLLSGPAATWKIKSLPPPGPGRKYLIFSDVHRDARDDHREPLEPGSIGHFSSNARLFARILDEVGQDASGYTILEGGDCEELWFIRSVDAVGPVKGYPKHPDGSLDVTTRLGDIINTHRAIYDRLRRLHQAGRYFRIQGNHDSFVRQNPADGNATFNVLRDAMMTPAPATGPSPAFEIWDACVIPGVKTMAEHSAGELLGDAWDYKQKRLSKDQLLARLLRSHLGLDSSIYTDKAKMVVAHGHQFDFWNCPSNEIVGLLISNTVATFLDRHMDRILELRGLAWQGNPVVDFQEIFANLPVLGGWPKGAASVELAHRVQHMPGGRRVLEDGLMYCESVVALWAAFGIALSGPDEHGVERTPAESRGSLDLTSPAGIREYLRRHHFHHVCIGHTHVPHSQPYFTLANVATYLPPPFSWIVGGLQRLLPDFLEPTVKTMYSNSGTGGWMEGVIWATQIDETGQSRLVYWTEKTRADAPETMDWELDPLDPRVRDHLAEAFKGALDAPGAQLSENLADLVAKLKKRLEELNVAADAFATARTHTITLPLQVLALPLLERVRNFSPTRELQEIEERVLRAAKGVVRRVVDRAAQEVQEAVDQAVDELKQQLEKLRGFTIDVFLSMKRRALQGFESAKDFEYLIIRAPISQAAIERLRSLQSILQAEPAPGETPQAAWDRSDAALHQAGLAAAVFDGFPRNVPFFSNRVQASNYAVRVQASDQPVLQSLLSMLWMYPVAGTKVEVGGVAMWSRFTLEGVEAGTAWVKLTVKLAKAGAQEPPQPSDRPNLVS